MSKIVDLDWNNLGFEYIKTDFRYISTWKDGSWDNGSLTDDNYLHISEASCALHYGQQCFEGLKAYRTKDGSIQLFRPDRNAERLNSSLRKLLMPEIPVEKFIDACMQVVKANEHFVPPYGSGATLYLRPFVIGVGHNIGVKPAPEYIFSVFCMASIDFCVNLLMFIQPTSSYNYKMSPPFGQWHSILIIVHFLNYLLIYNLFFINHYS